MAIDPSKFQAPICRIAAAVAAAAAADKWQGGGGGAAPVTQKHSDNVTTGHSVTVQKKNSNYPVFFGLSR
jgi:hypothetical protein